MEVITLPKLGISDEGTLIAWKIDVGESVTEGELLAIFESDKASAEVTATAGGVLLETYLEEGDVIPIEPGRPIAVIGDPDEEPPSYEAVAGNSDDESTVEEEDGSTADETSRADAPAEDVKATPRARKYAKEADIELGAVEWTGPQNAVTEDDVIAFEEAQGKTDGTASEEASAEDDAEEPARKETDSRLDEEEATNEDPSAAGLTVAERRELTETRQTIADQLSKSARKKPHVMGTREISIKEAEQLRSRLTDADGHDVSLNGIILLAVARTLKDLPAFNAWYDGDTHQLLSEVNIGYAVDTPHGLIVPVLKAVDEKEVITIDEERRTKVERVRSDEHTPMDLKGGTFTVTNVGALGIDASYSIINPPQVAILAVGRRKPAAFERDGEISFERAIEFSLTIDHRVLNGADTGAFLFHLDDYLQHPYRLLTGLNGS